MADVALEDLPPPPKELTADDLPPPQATQQTASLPRSLLSAALRPVIGAVTSIPGLAADTGVAVRNIAEQGVNKYAPSLAQAIYGMNRKLAGNSSLMQSILPQGPPAGNYQSLSSGFNQELDRLLPAPSTTADKAANFVSTALLSSRLPAPQASEQAPANFDPNALKNLQLKQFQKEGLVTPPSTANPSFTNRLLGGLAGKLKVQQGASIQNQPMFQELAARALGQNPDAALTPGALDTIRSEASAAGYEPLRNFGQMSADETFTKAIDSLTAAAKGATRSFPGIKPASPADDVLAALKQPTFDSGDAIDATKVLRDLANDAYGSGNKSLGKIYKSAKSALEDLMQRNLENAGESSLVDAFKAARQQIAKTYSVQKALVGDTGQINAKALANQLDSGKLSGDLATIARFAKAFPKASQVPTESFETISPLDAYGSAIAAAASGSPAPLMVPLTRAGLQSYLLSPAGQARAFIPSEAAPKTLGGLGLLNGVSGILGQQ